MRLFGGRPRLKKAALAEYTGPLPNPAAGWYRIYEFPLEVPAHELEPQWHLAPGEELAFLLVNIGAFHRRELDEAALENLARGLEFFRRGGKELILRCAYDCVGRGVQSEPAQFDRVARHLAQLTQVIRQYQRHIFVYQGMLLGSWGEMHSSRFLTKPRMKTLLSILEQTEGPFLAVRRPVYYRMLRKERGPEETRLGLFDDAILSSQTDMGTFGWESRQSVGWEAPWLPEEELDFEDDLCRRVPQGGEALLPQTGAPPLKQAAAMLKRMHITYLNSQYDSGLLNLWKQQRWESSDGWNGMNGYDYLGRHLGYRFCLRDVTIKRAQGRLAVWVTVENVGFAPIYQDCQVQLVQLTRAGEEYRIPMKGTLLALAEGTVTLTAEELKPEKSRLFIRLFRRSDAREIFFATHSPQQPPDTQGLFLGSLE